MYLPGFDHLMTQCLYHTDNILNRYFCYTDSILNLYLFSIIYGIHLEVLISYGLYTEEVLLLH